MLKYKAKEKKVMCWPLLSPVTNDSIFGSLEQRKGVPLNKLTFWEYFTSSFPNRLLTKNIGKTDKAVLLLLEQVSEAIF